jgi:hypothetical protein
MSNGVMGHVRRDGVKNPKVYDAPSRNLGEAVGPGTSRKDWAIAQGANATLAKAKINLYTAKPPVCKFCWRLHAQTNASREVFHYKDAAAAADFGGVRVICLDAVLGLRPLRGALQLDCNPIPLSATPCDRRV